jgi:dCTP deaminase
MSSSLSKYDQWIPGVLSMRQVKDLIQDGYIEQASPDVNAFDHSSMDLHLTDEGYRLPGGSIKPSGGRYLHGVSEAGSADPMQRGDDGAFFLEQKKTYIFKLTERLNLRRFMRDVGDIHGQATAKSSVGRVDVLARLIVDGARDYEMFGPKDFSDRDGNGDMYLEITPITFNVKVKPGGSVNQLRLFLGPPDEVELRGEVLYRRVLRNAGERPDGSLSVDLDDATIRGVSGAALVATDGQEAPICLWKREANEQPKPWIFWKLLRANDRQRLTIEMENFYLLRSKERIALPKGVAVYCRASDETIGEMRIHYAGFVHPFFGHDRSDGEVGTPLIFEVRGHNVNVSLVDRERMAKLTFYRMSEDAEAGTTTDKSYNNQQLELSKYFGSWPAELTRKEDGTLLPKEE